MSASSLRQHRPADANADADADAPMMVVFHDALRRDLERLARSTAGIAGRQPGRRPGLEAGWALFKTHLHVHHTAEDTALWPRMRDHLEGRDDDLELLEAMEAEHAEIDPLLDAVDAALADPAHLMTPARLHDAVNALRDRLLAHLSHEERDTVPLMDTVLTPADWSAFHGSQRRLLGIRGFAQLLPWLLDDAPPERIAQVIGALPRPIRFVYRRFWQPGLCPARPVGTGRLVVLSSPGAGRGTAPRQALATAELDRFGVRRDLGCPTRTTTPGGDCS